MGIHDLTGSTELPGLSARFAEAAQRLGLTPIALLTGLETAPVSRVDLGGTGGLPEAERAALTDAGISLRGADDDPSGAAQVAIGHSRVVRFRAAALSVADAAERLGVSQSRVRQKIADGSILTIPGGDGAHVLPSWQFAAGRLVPGLELIGAGAVGVHPLTLAAFMGRPDPDLQIDGRSASPVDWLLGGGDVTVVAELVAGLRAAG